MTNAQYYYKPFKNEPDSIDEQNLLWTHQEEWQRGLLCKYGSKVTIIDATYKTTKYNLPLFFYVLKQIMVTV